MISISVRGEKTHHSLGEIFFFSLNALILVEYTPQLTGVNLYWGSKGRVAPLGLLRGKCPVGEFERAMWP